MYIITDWIVNAEKKQKCIDIGFALSFWRSIKQKNPYFIIHFFSVFTLI